MIREFTDEYLNERAMEWDVLQDDQKLSIKLVQDLTDTLKSCSDRLYLCANEIGYKERAMCVKFGDEYEIFMNPIYQVRESYKLVREYDPITKKEFIIPRATDVTICFQDCIGNIKANKLSEQASIIICQAMDCLEGVHPSDYGLEIIPEFDSATDEERQELLNAYLKSMQKFRSDLDADLMSDDDTKSDWKQFKFMSAVQRGDVTLEKYVPEETNGIKLPRKIRRFLAKLEKRKNKKRGKK